jgi:hypothetical protein
MQNPNKLRRLSIINEVRKDITNNKPPKKKEKRSEIS